MEMSGCFTPLRHPNQDGSVVKCRISKDGGLTGEVRVLCDLPGTFVRQPIVVNGAGTWLLPVFRRTDCPASVDGDAERAAC